MRSVMSKDEDDLQHYNILIARSWLFHACWVVRNEYTQLLMFICSISCTTNYVISFVQLMQIIKDNKCLARIKMSFISILTNCFFKKILPSNMYLLQQTNIIFICMTPPYVTEASNITLSVFLFFRILPSNCHVFEVWAVMIVSIIMVTD